MRIFQEVLLICFLCITNFIYSQSVKVIVNNDKNLPDAGAVVQLMNAKDSSAVKYSISDKDGYAEFTNVKFGKYLLYINQLGYESYFSPPFIVDSIHREITLPTATLIPQTNNLNEVVVHDKNPVIQIFADKTVVNVQNSPLNAVGTVFDVIQSSPGVQVDPSDNISLQGKQGILVMIDGRTVPMSGSELANLLRSMPAESVDKIEFITNPSAKYDANGSAGIINIIMKKDKRIGLNGTVYAGYGQGIYPRTNDGFSFNDRTGKFNIFSSYNYSYQGFVEFVNFKTNFYNGSDFESSTQQNEYLKTPTITNSGRIGTDFFVSDKTTIGFFADVSVTQFDPSESTTTNNYDSTNNEKSYDLTGSNSPSTTYNYAGNFNFKHKFDSTGRELLVNMDYATYYTFAYQNITTNFFNIDNTALSGPSNLYGDLPGILNIYSVKADYDGQLGRNGTLGAGLKSSYVKTDNSVNIYDGTTSDAPIDTTQTNHFVYSENINAGYLMYSYNMHKASLQAGIRAEQTITNGNQVTTGQTFSHNFLQLFPNISVNDSLSASNQLGLSITRRIDRPTYEQLNPFSLYINPTFYLNGNPYLIPQISYISQLSDGINQKYFLTFTYTHTQYPITTEIEPYPGRPSIVEQTEENLSSSDNYDLDGTIASQITKWWNTSTSVEAFESHYVADISNSPLSTSHFLWGPRTENNITLSKYLSLEWHGFYSSGFDLGYLFIKSQWGTGGGLQLKVLKNKGSIKLSATDIFWTNVTNGITSFTGFNETVYVKRDTRAVNVSFTYHFGGTSQSSLKSKGGAEDEKQRVKSSS
jgi:iron complex outermembrane recepter protein